jgi:hypothetical protein
MSFPSQDVYMEHLPAVVGDNSFESLTALSPAAPLKAADESTRQIGGV